MRIESSIQAAESVATTERTDQTAGNVELLWASAKSFAPLSESLNEIDRAIDRIAEAGERTVAVATRKMQTRLRRTEPSVTMIGQVKAGKTTLVNAMVGMADLLPADVNPWTSVVTSIHLQKERTPLSGKAVFRFFSEDEWDRLTTRGGRIGELAGRAGADDELAQVAGQLAEMREKSKRRLGHKFELMMGQEHEYGSFDPDLVRRYVCLGDDFDDDSDVSSSEGRFADITKSADLYLHRPEFPMDLCIRDTPGVNDTFMMREQITIRAIRESRTCVVVLSAHQAMNTVDLALIRMISNVPSRDVVIFVNRIDELTDPEREVHEIRESIRETLRIHRGPEDAEIIFGSAYWAKHALCGTLDRMDAVSSEALVRWGEAQDIPWPEGDEASATDRIIWELSGVPRLFEVLSSRLQQGVGREVADSVARTALNLASSLETSLGASGRPHVESNVIPLNRQSLPAELERIEKRSFEDLSNRFDKLIPEFHHRLDHAHTGFIDRATGALIAHLEKQGESSTWTYDPTGLRILLRSAFQLYARRANQATRAVFERTAEEVRSLYFRAFPVDEESFWLEAPALPMIPPPVSLGKTIALDLSRGWWTRWWHRRRSYQSRATDFSELIVSETRPIVDDLKEDYGDPNRKAAEIVLAEFFASQRNILTDLANRSDVDEEEISRFAVDTERRNKAEALRQARQVLAKHISPNTMEDH